MKLVIQGVGEYDVQETLENTSLNDLYYLKVKTKTEEFPNGVSMTALGESLERFGGLDPDEILDNAEALMTLRALVFLCRRHAGDRVTLDTANDFPLQKFAFDVSDDEETGSGAAELDPPEAPAGSAPADEPPPGPATT